MATAASSVLELFKNGKYCDVTFKVKCGSCWSFFPAQKLILSIWSPIFAQKLQVNQNGFDNEIEIFDILPSTFSAFLGYLHGSTTELEESKNDVKFILNIYDVARKYLVERLKTECCEILNSSSPNINNVFELLDAAVSINSETLKLRCFKVLQSETETILNSQDIESVTPSMVVTLLQLPSLWLTSEYELLTWVFQWAKSYCSLHTVSNPQEFISTFLPYLKFTDLKSKDFAMLVSNYREFFDEVECFKIFMNIDLPESTELPNWYNSSLNSRCYKKPTEKAESVVLGDGAPELPYSINQGITNSDISNCDVYSISIDVEALISPPNVEEADGNDSVTIDDKSVNGCTPTWHNCHPTSLATADKEIMTDVSMNTNNEFNDTSLQSSADKETMTDVAMDSSNELNDTSLQSSSDKETMTDVAMDTNNEASDTLLESSAAMNENEASSMIEMAERGQENAPALETIDVEPGILWESLEPPLHLEKIKKKKIVKLYRLAEGKSLPNIGLWDPVLESPLKSCDIKSLSCLIERQQFHRRTSLT